MKGSFKVAVLGPPHSGKSVFLQGLCGCLPRMSRYLFRACPDGEGTWTWRSPGAAEYRRKGRFSREVVDWYVKSLAGCRLAPVVLVDLGGRMSAETARILREGRVDAAVVVSGDPGALAEWERFCRDCGVEVLASVHSDYPGAADDVSSSPMVVHRLERGEDVSGRPAVRRVAEVILERAEKAQTEKEATGMENRGVSAKDCREAFLASLREGALRIGDLAGALGKEKVEKVLPNGRRVEQVVWEGKDLVEVSRLLHSRSGEASDHVRVDGPAPAWLVVALVHELHPRPVSLNSPDGWVAVGCRVPEGSGAGENLRFRVHREGDRVLVECEQEDPSVPLRPEALSGVAPPEVGPGKEIILSGRMPNWLAASLAMSYHGGARSVALYQPGVGATVAVTHSAGVRLGSLVPEEDVRRLRGASAADEAVDAAVAASRGAPRAAKA